MEFWGVEVKPGQALVVKPGILKYLHLSQATLGEIKKDKANESVTIFLKIGGQKLVLGILSAEKFPQLSFDLVFEKEFELSHNGKGGSIYCAGYRADMEDEEHDGYIDSDSGSEDEELTLPPAQNGKPTQKEEKAIADKSNAGKASALKKPDAKPLKPSKAEDDDESDDDESDEDDDSDEESDEEMLEGDSSDSDDEDGDTESDEDALKVESTKKRSNESASKTTPLPSKKAKLASPVNTDSKKGAHTATPHPAKKTGKTPLKADSPKSGGQFSCKSCDRSFGSDVALQSHSKAKHGGK